MSATPAPTTDGLDHDTRHADYRLEWETDTDAGTYYGDEPDMLNDLAEHLRTEHDAHTELRGWCPITGGYNERVAA